MKTIFAIFAGAAGLLLAAFVIWFYLSTRTSLEGGSQPVLEMNRVGAMLFSLAFGASIASGGYIYLSQKNNGDALDSGFLSLLIVTLLSFFGTFLLLVIAHHYIPTMQYSDSGVKQSVWGYLIICGLPVVAGFFIGSKLEKWFSKK